MIKSVIAFGAVVACFAGTVAALSAPNADWAAVGGYSLAVSVQIFLDLTIDVERE